MRPASLHALNKNVDEGVVLCTANSMMSPSDIDRTVQPVFVVRSNVEQNRQAMLRMNAAERGVERHLSDGDAHTSCALVAQPEDSFSIADHDAFHVVVARMTQDMSDPFFVGIA